MLHMIYSEDKNIILLVADGCGISHQTIARWYKGAPLAVDQLSCGLCNTNSANSVITGSAAAATAFASGYKTWEQEGSIKCLGILPDSVVFPIKEKLPPKMQWKPVASVLEAAMLCKKSTGLVATARISHATPAAFSSHWHERDNESVIIKQQVYQNIDVVFGGGRSYLIPDSLSDGKRKDGENLVKVLSSRGYKFVKNRKELLNLSSDTKKVWGIFNNEHMCKDIDRIHFGKDEPSIADMTNKAISILSKNKNGFFLMVEGSQVDFASHNNDPVGVVTEYMAFDSAVQIAIDFAKKDGNTTVMVFTDHDNGGMSLGRKGDTYTDIQTEDFIPVLKKCKITSAGLLDTLTRCNKTSPIDFKISTIAINKFLNIDKLTSDDSLDIKKIITSVQASGNSNSDIASIGNIISRRASIGWTTYGHTGTNVWIYGLGVSFKSIIDNTEIAKICFSKLGVTRDSINDELFQEVNELFEKVNSVNITMDTAGVGNGNGSVTVFSPVKKAIFPFFKNEMWINGDKKIEMEGVTVFSQKNGKAYLPRQAYRLFLEK